MGEKKAEIFFWLPGGAMAGFCCGGKKAEILPCCFCWAIGAAATTTPRSGSKTPAGGRLTNLPCGPAHAHRTVCGPLMGTHEQLRAWWHRWPLLGR